MYSLCNGIHSNGIESFWAILKRGIYGISLHISTDYPQRYVNEFCFRLNYRNYDVAFEKVLSLAIIKRLLVNKPNVGNSENVYLCPIMGQVNTPQLTPEQRHALDTGFKTGSSHCYRVRCHSWQLSKVIVGACKPPKQSGKLRAGKKCAGQPSVNF
jgi:hypothetical protein